ncbi:selenium metabolism-associated LysR family transcriptional regulator [Geobacter sp. AOG1]|uniref:selenium metabolism-associated LysR family transcriptional regulator n=1 Tax=Geobacter sp. AOG1 TaxID=1566346 RepID=UPI001CC4FDEB|nr:selenium metabolism-associated LysR family transcriptional regulator [Geobacter sp. AOG1]GFE58890.1 LysR family transcriptional regulator [Geobacter sp. AOG1]
MNLKQLEVFLAVADTGSFSRGAEATFLTQSTVSQHIAALEKEFDLRLLDRTGRGALMTEGGKLLHDHARQILADVTTVGHVMRRFRGVEEAVLRVGGSNIPGDYLIPAALPLLLERFPGLQVTLVQGDSHEILEKLTRETVEIGIVGSADSREDVDFEPLVRDRIRLVIGHGHRWRDRDEIALADLIEEPLILREDGSGTGKALAAALQQAGISIDKLTIKARLGSNEAVKQAVTSGVGVAFMSELSTGRELERGELAAIDVKGLQVVRSFYIATRTGRELSPAAQAFATVMKETYPLTAGR